jgi:hypothetical protein
VRAEAAELLAQLQAANHQLELVGGIGEELRDLKSGKAMRLATGMSRAAGKVRGLVRPV